MVSFIYMKYTEALSKAWSELDNIAKGRSHEVKFLNDNYTVDPGNRVILSLSCNVPAKDYLGILILHYIIKRLRGMPSIKGEWISFRELSGAEGYYNTFKKRVIDVIKRKYGERPDGILQLTERFNAKRSPLADVGVLVETFEEIPILITLWRGDEEFGPEANVLFD
ncbi:MAG: hypothetical protein A2Z72_05585, partial [Omnitrophica bacterium RBG_13_46_9]